MGTESSHTIDPRTDPAMLVRALRYLAARTCSSVSVNDSGFVFVLKENDDEAP